MKTAFRLPKEVSMDFRLYSLNRIDYLEKIIQEMHGDIFLNIGSNEPMNLKKERDGLEILRHMTIGSEGVTLRITSFQDVDSIVKFLIGS